MTYGFIGLGNMASAIIGGMRRSDDFRTAEIFGCDISEEKCSALKEKYGLMICSDAAGVLRVADVVVLAVKPQVLVTAMAGFAADARPGQLFVSIAAGKEISFYESVLPPGTAVVRVMPNINALVGAAAIAVCGGTYATKAHVATVEALFSTVGRVFRLQEHQFSAFTALSGSSVAFAYMYIDAIAEAGAAAGIPKPLALEISAAAALGSAEMVSAGETCPADLVKMVCSPGGTTIEGVKSLRADEFEPAIMRAMEAVIRRDHELKG